MQEFTPTENRIKSDEPNNIEQSGNQNINNFLESSASLKNNFTFECSASNFIYMLKPKNLNKGDFIFGISLNTALIIWIIICVIISIGQLFQALQFDGFVETIIDFVICVLFCFTALSIIISLSKPQLIVVQTGYHMVQIFFILYAFYSIIYSLIKILKFFFIFSDDFLNVIDLFHIIGIILSLIVFSYFLWIHYCFLKIVEEKDNTRNSNYNNNDEHQILNSYTNLNEVENQIEISELDKKNLN